MQFLQSEIENFLVYYFHIGIMNDGHIFVFLICQ